MNAETLLLDFDPNIVTWDGFVPLRCDLPGPNPFQSRIQAQANGWVWIEVGQGNACPPPEGSRFWAGLSVNGQDVQFFDLYGIPCAKPLAPNVTIVWDHTVNTTSMNQIVFYAGGGCYGGPQVELWRHTCQVP